jgi:hypothetical protein
MYQHPNLFVLGVSDEEKKLYNIDTLTHRVAAEGQPVVSDKKKRFSSLWINLQNKLERFVTIKIFYDKSDIYG